MIRHLLFDAANTLIHKPSLWDAMLEVLARNKYQVNREHLIYNHKLLSETIVFPDRTNSDFYSDFNTELLHSLGIVASPQILKDIFEKCSYLPWESFEDLRSLNTLGLPMSILSNFNTSLNSIINEKVNIKFAEIISSEKAGVRKPDSKFYQLAVNKLGVAAHEILYVGDSLKLDYIPAKALGMHSLIIDRVDFFSALPYVISDLGSLQGQINLINKA